MGAGWVRSLGSNDRFKICKGAYSGLGRCRGASGHELPRLGVDRLFQSVVRRVARQAKKER